MAVYSCLNRFLLVSLRAVIQRKFLDLSALLWHSSKKRWKNRIRAVIATRVSNWRASGEMWCKVPVLCELRPMTTFSVVWPCKARGLNGGALVRQRYQTWKKLFFLCDVPICNIYEGWCCSVQSWHWDLLCFSQFILNWYRGSLLIDKWTQNVRKRCVWVMQVSHEGHARKNWGRGVLSAIWSIVVSPDLSNAEN